MTLQVKQGGVWTAPSSILVKQGTEWVEAQELYRKENGIWVSQWSGFGAVAAWDVTFGTGDQGSSTGWGLNTLLGYGSCVELYENDPLIQGNLDNTVPALFLLYTYNYSGKRYLYVGYRVEGGSANVPATVLKVGDVEINVPAFYQDKNISGASQQITAELQNYFINNVGNTLRVLFRRA
jgi:hypothetical protein